MYPILFIIAIALGIGLGLNLEQENVGKKGGGHGRLKAANAAIEKRKRLAKEKIMRLLKKQGRIRNQDVERLLAVSDATATNYLQELEKESRINQIGRRGRPVFYKKNG